MWLYIVGAGMVFYVIPYYCLSLILKKQKSHRGSSICLRETPEKEVECLSE